MMDIFDSPKWKAAYGPDGLFQGDPHGLSVQLSTDGVNPFSADKICYSMWQIMLSVLNWPKVCRNLFENVCWLELFLQMERVEPNQLIHT